MCMMHTMYRMQRDGAACDGTAVDGAVHVIQLRVDLVYIMYKSLREIA